MLHTTDPVIKHKAGLLNLAEELSNVSKACKIMGVSRDTFYRYRELVAEGGVDAQINRSRRARKQGVFISGNDVRSVWLRHNLENFKKRLKALEEKVARDGIELTDSQIGVKPVMTRPVAKSKRLIRDIWSRRTRSM